MPHNKKIPEGIILKSVHKFSMANKCKDTMKWILSFISTKLGVSMVCKSMSNIDVNGVIWKGA